VPEALYYEAPDKRGRGVIVLRRVPGRAATERLAAAQFAPEAVEAHLAPALAFIEELFLASAVRVRLDEPLYERPVGRPFAHLAPGALPPVEARLLDAHIARLGLDPAAAVALRAAYWARFAARETRRRAPGGAWHEETLKLPLCSFITHGGGVVAPAA